MSTQNAAIVRLEPTAVIEAGDGRALALAGQVANRAAEAFVFEDYRQRKSQATRRAQDRTLEQFAQLLTQAGAPVDGERLANDPAAWAGITWGLVEAFKAWLFKSGYAMSTVNARLSAIRVYARLAHKAGALDTGEYTRIRGVSGYKGTEQARANDTRRAAGIPTRVGVKKSEPVKLTDSQAEQLLAGQLDTPQGRRDAALLHLAIRHGLRVSELEALQVGDFTLTRKGGRVVSGVVDFYRPKVAGTDYERGQHTLTGATLQAVAAYLDHDALPLGPFFRSSKRGGQLTSAGMCRRSLTRRIKALAAEMGADGLTAHDCRHYSATRDGKRGKSINYLMHKFGWTSAQTASRYVHQDGPVIVD